MKLYRYYFLRFRMYTLCMSVEFVFDNRMFGIKNTSMYASVNPPYVSSYTYMIYGEDDCHSCCRHVHLPTNTIRH